MGQKLDAIIRDAKDELREAIITYEQDADSAMHEIADSNVPVYNYTLLELFTDDLGLAMTEPEYYGTAGQNMIGMAQAIIYGEIRDGLYDAQREIEDDLREIEELRGEREDLEEDLEEQDMNAEDRADMEERIEEIEEEIKELRGED